MNDLLIGHSIICFAGEDWWYHHPHEKTHILKRLAAENRILFINSLSLGLPSVSNPDFFLKIRRKLRSCLRWLRRVPEGIYVMTPIALPMFGSRWARLLNRVVLHWQIRFAQWWCGMTNPIVWVHQPSAVDVAEGLKATVLLYHITDKLDANEDSTLSVDIIRNFDNRLKQLADVVVYSGRLLFEEGQEPHRVLIQQGVDFQHFATEAPTTAEDIAGIPHPVLGYFGAMDYIMDMPLIEDVVRRRPEWNWAMIGLKSNLSALDAPNVHFLGSKPYHDLPAYVRHFDVCILPWHQDHPFTRYGSAMKVREYMATGKPIVMSPLYEYSGSPGVRFFHNSDEFIAAVEGALTRDTAGDRALRQSLVRHATWDDKTRQYAMMINSVLQAKATGNSVDFDRLRRELAQTSSFDVDGVGSCGAVNLAAALEAENR